MAFSIDSSTVNLAARRLEVIGNNVSNANTTGYKGSEFDQILASATAADGAGGSSGGRQSFSQGKITKTINPLDIAISGSGFFRVVNPSGEVSYTRSGRFVLNLDGEIVNAVGGQLTGYMSDDSGKIQTTGGPIALKIDRPIDPPQITETAYLRLTLDSRQEVPAQTFDRTVPDSYNHFTSSSVYDAQGKELSMQTYYVKDTTADNTWKVYAWVKDAQSIAGLADTDQPPAIGSIAFDTTGKLASVKDTAGVEVWSATSSVGTLKPALKTTIATGTTGTTSDVAIDFTDSVQYGTTFNVRSSQDGRGLGTMDDYTVTSEGLVTARYSNGYSATLGKVVLASFQNLNGLKAISQNEWIETLDSGTPSLGDPGVGAMGSLEASSIEEANIDLTEEMIKMIAAQRNFQVAAEMIKKQDEVTQTVANIGN